LAANLSAGTISTGNLPTLSVSLTGSSWNYSNSTKNYNPEAGPDGGYDYTAGADQAILKNVRV
jgi:hypothetical protein